jgi:hypothetical protein
MEANMLKLVVGAAIVAVTGLLFAPSLMASASQAVNEPAVAEQPQAQAPGATIPRGVLGPVNALGQEVRRPPASTGPPPRLPDGTIDLGDGVWVMAPGGGGVAQGLKPGEELPLLPSAKA